MDIFTDVKEEAYRTGTIFYYPRPNDSIKCLAVPRKTGQYLTAFYTILLILIISEAWKGINIIVMGFMLPDSKEDPKGTTEQVPKNTEKVREEKNIDIVRGMGVVGFWNAPEPLHALIFAFDYACRVCVHKPKVARRAWGLVLLAFLGVAGAYVSSIVVAGMLVIGTSAPARAATVYVPTIGTQLSDADTIRLQAQRAPAALRALGSAEAADVTVRNRVNFVPGAGGGGGSGKEPYQFTYGYTVTGYDMGLQHWSGLKQEVTGSCETEYGWIRDPDGDMDVYMPWNVGNKSYSVVRDGERNTAPYAQAFAFPYDSSSDPRKELPANNRYGILVHSSHRASYRPSSAADPWYATEQSPLPPANSTDARKTSPPGYRVKVARPAFSCTQKDVWSYNGHEFKNIYELADNIDFPDGWHTQLQLDFANPRIIDVINSAGPSSLVSSTTFAGGVFDAETSTVDKDIKRLLVATFIASCHTFRNMLMVGDNKQNIPNAAISGKNEPQNGIDKFVVSTPQVMTLRFSILVAVPATLVAMFLLLAMEYFVKKCVPVYRERTVWYEAAYMYARNKELEAGLQGCNKNPECTRHATRGWACIIQNCKAKTDDGGKD